MNDQFIMVVVITNRRYILIEKSEANTSDYLRKYRRPYQHAFTDMHIIITLLSVDEIAKVIRVLHLGHIKHIMRTSSEGQSNAGP